MRSVEPGIGLAAGRNRFRVPPPMEQGGPGMTKQVVLFADIKDDRQSRDNSPADHCSARSA
jgi:hypothetical protein